MAWDEADLAIARDLRDTLGRAGASRAARLEMARAQLQTISMLGQLI